LEAGAGKQNTVMVVCRYALLLVVVGFAAQSSSMITMMVDHSPQAPTVTVTNFYL
jgi:hypothetical protein